MPRTEPAGRRWLLVALLALCAVAAYGYSYCRGKPVAVADAPPGPLACVSYAPYYRDAQTPFRADTWIEPAQIDADMRVLSRRFGCVRTYSVGQGLDAVPRLAAHYGMQTLMGVWIGRDRAANEKEIVLAVRVAQATRGSTPAAIRAIVVGNEVLLRRELPAAELRDYIVRVARDTALPVTYADVWEFWIQNPQLSSAVSFVTVHMLPYWEDHPIPVSDAIEHLLRIYQGVQREFPGKSILIGETGWPSLGRQRGGAVPGRVNQARFVREFVLAAHARGIPYNLVEAYDQPWKRALEGAVGGYWGYHDGAGAEKFPLQGALAEDPAWRNALIAGCAGALSFLAFAWLGAPRMRIAGALAAACAGFTGGVLLISQWRQWMATSRTALEMNVAGAYTALALLSALLLTRALAAAADAPPATNPMPARGARRLGCWLGWLRLPLLFGAAYVSVLLVFDSRYRDFPLSLYAAPAAGYALLAVFSPALEISRARLEEKTLAAVLCAAALFIAVNEGPANGDALAWCALCLLFAAPVLGMRARQGDQGEQRAHGRDLVAVEHEAGNAQV